MKWRAMTMIVLCLAVSGCAYSTRTAPTCAQSVPAEAVSKTATAVTIDAGEPQTVNGYYVTTD